jgi:hypothetical protein
VIDATRVVAGPARFAGLEDVVVSLRDRRRRLGAADSTDLHLNGVRGRLGQNDRESIRTAVTVRTFDRGETEQVGEIVTPRLAR